MANRLPGPLQLVLGSRFRSEHPDIAVASLEFPKPIGLACRSARRANLGKFSGTERRVVSLSRAYMLRIEEVPQISTTFAIRQSSGAP